MPSAGIRWEGSVKRYLKIKGLFMETCEIEGPDLYAPGDSVLN